MTIQDDKQQTKILLLGVGNVLLKDEGAGVHTVNRLREIGLPENVEAVDGGTAGLELLYLLEGVSKMIVVDCLDAGAEPGALFRFRPDDVTMKDKVKISFHDIGLMEVLTLAETMGTLPETVIFGIQPKEIGWDLNMSPEIEKVIPQLMDLITKEISDTN